MSGRTFKVQYLTARNNFCYLCSSVIQKLKPNASVKITHGDNLETYFSVGPSPPSMPDNTIGINSLYGKLLGIEENSDVIVTEIGVPCKVQCFTITPVRSDDYHVLDLLQKEVENCVLKQTKLVAKDQGLIIWIGDNLNIPVKVGSVFPISPGMLDNLTELVIIPLVKKTNIHNNLEEESEREFINRQDIIQTKSFDADAAFNLFNIPEKLTHDELRNKVKMEVYSNRAENFDGRLVPFDCLKDMEISKYFYDFSVFMLKSVAPLEFRNTDYFKEPIFCSLRIIKSPDTKPIFVRIYLIEEYTLNNLSVISNNIFVHDSLLSILNCEIGAHVLLEPLRKRHVNEEIILHVQNSSVNAVNLLKEYLANICVNQEFVLNTNVPIRLDKDFYCSLKFKPHSGYCWIDDEFLRNCKYKIEEDSSVTKLPVKMKPKDVDFVGIKCHQSICDEILKNLTSKLIQNVQLSSTLITGNIGSGKSRILDKMKSSLLETPLFVYSEIVKCKTLKGKTMDSLHREFTTIFENLVAHQPAILFIDDLNVMCENVDENDALAQNAVYYNRISEMLYLLFTSVTSHYSIGIIATTDSTDKLNKNIYSSRGCYLFENVYNIEDLKKNDRKMILEHYLNDYNIDIDFENLSQKTEGYVFQDLFDFSQKAIFEAIKDDQDLIAVEQAHCESVLSQMTILSLTDVKLHSPGDKDFSNVGGLTDIKNLMIENLLWPLKYPNLFSTAPLRLQSGLLLYGPPGTGKTLIVAAAAKQCGVRLISIKGPELLSKYIGASEQGVRDVFVKAQNAKPCILFFDEFDSLAPRRGHDITGVTDRVVNQLLTQMDGVESLSGVCVIAATSRPDLLDPALLRPGRLDKQILCPLPDQESRLDILQVLSKTMNLSDDVNLTEIAKNSDGFSGADLQSLLYNAQLSTMEHLLLSEDNKEICDPKPISQEMLRSSLSKTRPSLTKEEKKKYDFIYSKFQGKADMTYLKPGTKASLA